MSINKLIFIYSLLMIIISIVINFIINKKFFLINNNFISKVNFIIKLISNSFFIMFIYFLFLIYVIKKFFNNKLLYKIIFITLLTVILGQIIKILIKNTTKIKRLNTEFNKKTCSLKKNNYFIKNKLINFITNILFLKYIYLLINKFLKINNLYSFPSGHIILIHNLLSLIIIFSNDLNINIILLFILIFWSFMIIYNRIFFKMHKLIDIIFGILINFILIILVNIFYIKLN